MHMPGWRLLSVVVSLVVLGVVIELLRRRSLREKYAAVWLAVGIGVLALAVFPDTAGYLADAVGVAVPSNLVFLISGMVLLIVSLHLSGEVGRLEEEMRTGIEELALLRCELTAAQQELAARIEQLEAAAVTEVARGSDD